VQSGSPIPFSSRAGPRALARSHPRPRSPHAANRPTPPVSDTAARYCAGPPVSPLSPTLSPTERARATHVARPRHARAAAGATRWSGPDPTSSRAPRGTPHARDPLSLPFFPLSTALPPSALRLAPLRQKPDFSSLSDHSLERSSLSATPRTRTAVSGHRRLPLPREFRPTSAAVRLSPVSASPSFQSLRFLAISSPPRLSRAAGPPQPRRQPPETPHR
jgi:hypothetical protein